MQDLHDPATPASGSTDGAHSRNTVDGGGSSTTFSRTFAACNRIVWRSTSDGAFSSSMPQTFSAPSQSGVVRS